MIQVGNNYIFKRVEKKYLLTKWQYELLREEISKQMVEDDYGLSTICNLYYDTDDYSLIRQSIEKPLYKEKFRVRCYGIPQTDDHPIYLEIKKKYNGVVYKRRTKLEYAEAISYLTKGIRPHNDNQILKEIDYFMEFHKPCPKVYISYDRIATYGKEDPSLRITFDFDIKSRFDHLDLSYGNEDCEILLPGGEVLMEIKASGSYPIWLSNLLSKLKIYPSGFSKYGYIYKKSLMDTGNEAARIEMDSLSHMPKRAHIKQIEYN